MWRGTIHTGQRMTDAPPLHISGVVNQCPVYSKNDSGTRFFALTTENLYANVLIFPTRTGLPLRSLVTGRPSQWFVMPNSSCGIQKDSVSNIMQQLGMNRMSACVMSCTCCSKPGSICS